MKKALLILTCMISMPMYANEPKQQVKKPKPSKAQIIWSSFKVALGSVALLGGLDIRSNKKRSMFLNRLFGFCSASCGVMVAGRALYEIKKELDKFDQNAAAEKQAATNNISEQS